VFSRDYRTRRERERKNRKGIGTDDFDSSLSRTAARQTIGKQSRADISAERNARFTAVCTDGRADAQSDDA
jgi:hypothetical protein